MGAPFSPLPPDLFPEKARPHIMRLNKFLADLSRLEGVLRSATTDAARSDATVQRNADPAVAVTRVTPSVSPGSGSGASVTIGTPALTLSTTNIAGSTTSVVSVNSQIALFGTAGPQGISTGSFSGTSAYAAREDHVHGLTDSISVQKIRVDKGGATVGTRPEINFIEGNSTAITVSDDAGNNKVDVTVGFSGSVPAKGTPALTLTTSNSAGVTSGQYIGVSASIAIFGLGTPAVLDPEVGGAVGTSAFAARADHVHPLSLSTTNMPDTFSNVASSGSQQKVSKEDHIHKSETSGDWYASGTTRGMITVDYQPRYWRIRVHGSTSVVTGGCTLSISSGGAVTATRDAGSSGTIVIRIDDFGTSAP